MPASEMRIYHDSFAALYPNGESVYYVACLEFNAVKVGFSADVDRRLEELQASCPARLTLLGKEYGTQSTEVMIQQKFSHLRINNEWFHLTPELITYIDSAVSENAEEWRLREKWNWTKEAKLRRMIKDVEKLRLEIMEERQDSYEQN